MSILLVQLVPEGLLLGADRNITSQLVLSDGEVRIVVSGQSERPKVLKWPNQEVIVGYVGAAEIDGEPTDEWLYGFIGRNLHFPDLKTLASTLAAELDAHFRGGKLIGDSILHLGGFEQMDGEWTPRVYFIRNTTALNLDGSYECGDHFDCSEELATDTYFGDKSGSEIRDYVRNHLFSFRQGYDLGSFGAIDEALRGAMKAIVYTHPRKPHPEPTTLREWAKHVALAVRGYGAYFAAFYPPFEQYVGGGADVVWAAWPSIDASSEASEP
jgi:hypothetical protein